MRDTMTVMYIFQYLKTKMSKQSNLLTDEESSNSEDDSNNGEKKGVETSDSEGSDGEDNDSSNSEENSEDDGTNKEEDKEGTKKEIEHVIKMKGLLNSVKEVGVWYQLFFCFFFVICSESARE